MASVALLLLVLTYLTPGGALREDFVPQLRPSHSPLSTSVASPLPAFAVPFATQSRLCRLPAQLHYSMAIDKRPTLWIGEGPRGLPVQGRMRRLQLRSGAMLQRRTGPLSMAEKEKETKVEKTPAEIEDLNFKLWTAAEKGDADLIRSLVGEGAEVNSAPFVADEEEDDEGENYTTMTSVFTSEITQSQDSGPNEVTMSSSDGKDKEETPEERKKRKAKEKKRKKKLDAANKGPSALHRACESGKSDAVCALVDLGADVNCLTCEVLVTLGADLKAKNQMGETAVDMGKRLGTDKEVIEFLEMFNGLLPSE